MNKGIRTAVVALFLSAAGLTAIMEHEDFRAEAYPDSGGVATLGHGTTLGVKFGDKTTREEAKRWLIRDSTYAGDAIKRCVKVPLYQHEYDAYVDFAYNVGGTAFCKSTLVKVLNAGEYTAACMQMYRWRYVKDKDCNIRKNNCYGIILRREDEVAMCLGEAA